MTNWRAVAAERRALASAHADADAPPIRAAAGRGQPGGAAVALQLMA
jgi:hypothetical protein